MITALRLRKLNNEHKNAIVVREHEGLYCVREFYTELSRAVGYRRLEDYRRY